MSPACSTSCVPVSTFCIDWPMRSLISLAALALRCARLRTSEATTAKPRRRAIAIVVGLLTLVGALLLPASGATAARPVTGQPKKPVAVVEFNVTVAIHGETENSNYCGGIYCHTYLSIMRQQGAVYVVHAWVDISSLTGVQTIDVDPAPGTVKYRTAVHDYVSFSTPAECGPASTKIKGVTYKRFSCANGVTTYVKIYSSASRTITALLFV